MSEPGLPLAFSSAVVAQAAVELLWRNDRSAVNALPGLGLNAPPHLTSTVDRILCRYQVFSAEGLPFIAAAAAPAAAT